jgi:thiosulfate/3-mercaptopyruvate sulfurtransferase
MSWLINASQLDRFRKNPKGILILDATWAQPGDATNPHADFLKKHIPGARFLDLSRFYDQSSALPNMLTRDENLIASILSEYGITSEHKIIFYDNSSMHTSCRALWMFKVFGHASHLLYILEGGLNAWEKYGGKAEVGEPKPVAAKPYTVMYQAQYIRSLVQMKTNLHHSTEQVVDVRNAIRFAGGAESRKHLRAGHMPGSYCFPFTTLFEIDGRWKPVERIRRQLNAIGVDLNAPIVTSCGSGTTAPILNFALDLLGCEQQAMYDGSWSEWGADECYPGETSIEERPVVTSLV